MGRSRAFGSILYKPDKKHPKRIVTSYPTPVDAFDRWPSLPIRQSKIFRPGMEDNARAWLSQAHKRIDDGVWEPAAVKKSRAVA